MAADLDAFLDGKDSPNNGSDLDSFLDQDPDAGTMSESRLLGKRAADWLGTGYLGDAAAAVSGAVQGGTFGFSDEIGGALGWLTGNGYEGTRDSIREFQDELGTQHPKSNFVGDLAGSIAVPGAAAKLAARGLNSARATGRLARMAPEDREAYDLLDALSGKLSPMEAPGNPLMNKMRSAIGVGAGAGALRSAGENEKPEELLGDIAQGGALGGITGAVGGGIRAGGDLAGKLHTKIKGDNRDRMIDLITTLDDTNPALGKTLGSLYDADPKMAERLVGRLMGPRIDLPSMGTMGLNAGGLAARHTGNAMMRPGVAGSVGTAMGAMSAERMDATDKFLEAGTEVEDRPKPSLTKIIEDPDLMIDRLMGTPYARQLADALSEGDESFRARVYVLAQRPEFRRVLGLD